MIKLPTYFFKLANSLKPISTRSVKHWGLGLLLAMGSHTSLAQNPSAAQVAQFKSLSPGEQKAIAQSMGVNPSALGGQQGNSQQSLSEALSNTKNDSDAEIVDGSTLTTAKKRRAKRSENAVFGLDLFHGDPESFTQAANIPVPNDYVMGPGDNLFIQLYGKENLSLPVTVNREGQIQFPNIGPLTIAGLTFQQAQELINTTVAERKVGVKASTTMGTLRTIQVFVLGEVEHPGSFIVGSLATITNALFVSGGVTIVGSLRNIELKRQGKTVAQLDLYDLLLAGNTQSDIRLKAGDVIFVPPVGRNVHISGSVNRPARYELKNSRNLEAIVKMAGGLKNTSHAAKVAITRINDIGERSLYNVDLTTREGKAFKVESGDQISVGRALDFINNQVTLHGSAKRPGVYSWRPGLRFTDLVDNAFEVIPGTDINIALLQSMSPTTGLVETRLFSPMAAWSAPNSDADPQLEGYDEVFLFDLSSNRSAQLSGVSSLLKQQAKFNERQQTVFIQGSVKFSGEYPRTLNMSIAQLIELAGGLKESAFGTSGEITRYSLSEQLERTVTHIKVDLQANNTAIEAGDTLNIKQVPLWAERERITLRGEVMFPGEYSIKPGETLSQVLERAGGLTPYAYPVGAIFSREELRRLEQERLNQFKQQVEQSLMSNAVAGAAFAEKELSTDHMQMLVSQANKTRAVGRMVIDLPNIMESPADYDFAVEDGDILLVPRFKPSVTVIGEVQYPTSHFFDKKLSSKNYIQRSGGTKETADSSRTYIVKANGLVIEPSRSKWFRAKSARVEPGDTIVVPLDTTIVSGLEVWSTTTEILYQAAIGAAAVASF